MEVSNYIISTIIDDNRVLLFSTLTTAFIIISNEEYDKVFINKDFTGCKHIGILTKLGFLVNNKAEQMQLLDNLSLIETTRREPVIKIFPTNRCNARCYYCFEEGIKFVDMSEETAMQLVKFTKQFYQGFQKLQVNWFGGEPLMNFKIIQLITEELKNAGFSLTTHVTTNGSLLTPDMVSYFKNKYIDCSFQITIDDIGKAYYNVKKYIDLTESNAFETVINNIKLLLINGIRTRIRINFLEEHFSHVVEIFDYLMSLFNGLPTPDIYFAPLTFEHKKMFDNNKDYKNQEPSHLSILKFYTRRNILYDKDNIYKNTLTNLSLKPKAIPCGACRFHNLTMTAEGLIFKCHRIVTEKKYSIGTVFDGIKKNSKYNRLFIDKDFEDPKCLECNVYPVCRGGCKVESMIFGKREKICGFYNNHPELIKLYYEHINSQNHNNHL